MTLSLRAHAYLPERSILRIQVGCELRLVVQEERIVRRKHHPARDAIGVVHVVEGVGRHGVQWDCHTGVAVLGAHLLQMTSVVHVQRRVHAVAGAWEVVQARHDLRTARPAYRVRTCMTMQIKNGITGAQIYNGHSASSAKPTDKTRTLEHAPFA